MQQQCAEGYTGTLCAVCGDGYVLTSSGFECTTCPPHATAVTAVIGAALVVVAVTQIMLLAIEHFKEVAPRRGGGDSEARRGSRVALEDEANEVEGGKAEEGEEEVEEQEEEPERASFGEVWKVCAPFGSVMSVRCAHVHTARLGSARTCKPEPIRPLPQGRHRLAQP